MLLPVIDHKVFRLALTRQMNAVSPVSYTHLDVYKRQIQEGMSEIQTVKTAIHEIAHAKLHALDQPEPEPKWKLVMVSEGGTTHDYRTCLLYTSG